MASEKRTLAQQLRSGRTLRAAWRHVRESALASDSRETRDAALQFEANLDSELPRIQRQLREDKYRFAEAQAIVKKRRGKTPRPIVVAPIRDRVVQRALLETVLGQRRVREAVHTEWSYGGLRGVGVPDAIRAACERLGSGAGYFLTSDIAGFFTRIPRAAALAELDALLPDATIREVLEEATRVELRDPLFLRDDAKLFPTHELGVAQGCCLSPLLGNVLLRRFDEVVGQSEGVRLFRYIDDVLILGRDRSCVRRAFRCGRGVLRSMGLELYDPDAAGSKAAAGSTRRGFDYLGCKVSTGYVVPSRDARAKIQERIRLKFSKGKTGMIRGDFTSGTDYRESLVEVLSDVSNVIRGWANQYAFCNAESVMNGLDEFVDAQLASYLGMYADRRRRVGNEEQRRILGVRLFVDGNRDPIYPLNRVA